VLYIFDDDLKRNGQRCEWRYIETAPHDLKGTEMKMHIAISILFTAQISFNAFAGPGYGKTGTVTIKNGTITSFAPLYTDRYPDPRKQTKNLQVQQKAAGTSRSRTMNYARQFNHNR
jgi:hypothetical protein